MKKKNCLLFLFLAGALPLASCRFSYQADSSASSASIEGSISNASSESTSEGSSLNEGSSSEETASSDKTSSLDGSSSATQSSSSTQPSSTSAQSSSNSSQTSSSSSAASSSSSSRSEEGVMITSCLGAKESISVVWAAYPKASSYQVAYEKTDATTYTRIDDELIEGTKAVIVGLSAGTYRVKVTPVFSSSANESLSGIQENVTVESYDRSGYAHFDYSDGVGAYNDDGTLKKNAVVVYVSNDNKNTVTATLGGKTYTGLVSILQKSQGSVPLDIRIKGVISTNQFASKTLTKGSLPYDTPAYYENTLESTYPSNLKGLQNSVWGPSTGESYWNTTVSNCTSSGYSFKWNKVTSSSGTDSYFNMCDVASAKNVTVEGVSSEATIEQWGFTWKQCQSIEVRNLLFQNYVEDACSFQGGSNSNMDYHHFWLHNCRFNRGLNHWDLTYEQDKSDGDGGFDLKYLGGVTSSNNIFYDCHKTGLVGGSDSAYTKDVTFHHNKYWKCSSRLPLGRQANMHFYNNYYLSCTTCQDIRAHSYTFSEANYFQDCSIPCKVDSTAVVKSYNDVLTNCGSSKATVVTDRTTELSNTCKPDGSSDYSKFTTDSSLFYYDSVNKKSDVSLYLSAADVPGYVEANAGVAIL